MEDLMQQMFGDVDVVRPVPTAKDKAFGVLEEYYNNPYLKDSGLPSRIMVWHEGKLCVFNTQKLVEEYKNL